MIRILSLAALLAQGCSSSAEADQAVGDQVVGAITPDVVELLFTSRELPVERRTTPAGGERSVIRLGDWNVSLLYLGCEAGGCGTLQLHARFDLPRPVKVETVNAWNGSHAGTRAYLDKGGRPVLEADLDLAGGVTIRRIEHWIHAYQGQLDEYAKYVGFYR